MARMFHLPFFPLMQRRELGSDHWLDGSVVDISGGDNVTHFNRTREWSQQDDHPFMPFGHTLAQDLDNWQSLEDGCNRPFYVPDLVAPPPSPENSYRDSTEFSSPDAENSSVTPVVESFGNSYDVNTKSEFFDTKQDTCNGQQLLTSLTLPADDDIFDDDGFHSHDTFDDIYKHNSCVNARSTSSRKEVLDADIHRKSLHIKGSDFGQCQSLDWDECDTEMTSYSEGTSLLSGVDGDSCLESDTISGLFKSLRDFPRSAALQEIHSWKRDVLENSNQTTNCVNVGSQGWNFMSPRCKSVDSSMGFFQDGFPLNDFSSSFSTTTLNAKADHLNPGSWNNGSNFLESHQGTFSHGEFSGNFSYGEGAADFNAIFDVSQGYPTALDVMNLSRKFDGKAPRRSRHQSLPDKGSDRLFSSAEKLSMISNFDGNSPFDKHSLQFDGPSTSIMDEMDEQSLTNDLSALVSPDTTQRYDGTKRADSHNQIFLDKPHEICFSGENFENLRGASITDSANSSFDKEVHPNTSSMSNGRALSLLKNLLNKTLTKPGSNPPQEFLEKQHSPEIQLPNTSNGIAMIPSISSDDHNQNQMEIHPNTSSIPSNGESTILKKLLTNVHTVTKQQNNPPQGFLNNRPPPAMELPGTSDGIAMTPSTSSDDHNQNRGPGDRQKMLRGPLKSEEMLEDHLDESLKEAFNESARTGKLTPIIKQELRMKIMYNRCRQGKGDIIDDSSPKPVYELTEEEKEKYQKKLERNKVAASKCRKRKQAQKQKIEQDLKDEEEKNTMLRKKVQSLTVMKHAYLIKLMEKSILNPSSATLLFPDSKKQKMTSDHEY